MHYSPQQISKPKIIKNNTTNNNSNGKNKNNKEKINKKLQTSNESLEKIKSQRSFSNNNTNTNSNNNTNTNRNKNIRNIRVLRNISPIKINNNSNNKVHFELPKIVLQSNNKKSSSYLKRNMVLPMTKFNEINIKGKKNNSHSNDNIKINQHSLRIKDDLDYLNEIKRQNNVLISRNNNKIKSNDIRNYNDYNKQHLYPDINYNNIVDNYTNQNKILPQNIPIVFTNSKPYTSSVVLNKNSYRNKRIITKTLGIINEEDELIHNDDIKTASLTQYKQALNNESLQRNGNSINNNNNAQIDDSNPNSHTDNNSSLLDIEKIIELRKGYKSSFLH